MSPLPHARRAVRSSPLLALLLAAVACSDASAPDAAALRPPERPPIPLPGAPVAEMPRGVQLVTLSDSDGAVIAGGQAYAPTVRVIDDRGRAVPNMTVRFGVMGRGGRVAVERVATDADGVATAGSWSADTTPGMQEVRAYAGDTAWTRFRLTAVPATGPLAMDAQCPVADSIAPTGWRLPGVARRLASGAAFTVVSIGSSSTAGAGASTPDSSYPALLGHHLRRRFPRSEIRSVNAGIGGQSLEQLRARFASDVLSQHPQLVILQTGTIDYMIGVPIDVFAAQLRSAIAQLQDGGAEVVLLDSQWYPGGETDRYRLFQRTIASEGAARGVPVARRYAWMADMAARGIYTPAQLLYADVFHPSDLTYSCTARILAEGVVRAVAGTVAR
jgi:acyl-CoA thioesterase I